jgi:hypothetical protein
MLPGKCLKHGEFYGLMCSECLKPEDISEFLTASKQAKHVVSILASPFSKLLDPSVSYVELPALMHKLDQLIDQQPLTPVLMNDDEREVYEALQLIEENNSNLSILKPLPTTQIEDKTNIKALPYHNHLE